VARTYGEKCIQGFGMENGRKGPFGRPRRRWEDIKMEVKLNESAWS
jgi:hypothetical protein